MLGSSIDSRRRFPSWLASPLGLISLACWLVGLCLWSRFFLPGPRVARNIAIGTLWISVVFGIAGVFWPRARGRTLPAIGMVLGLLSLFFCHLTFSAALRSCAANSRCAANIKRLTTALLFYAESHGGRLPDRLEDLVPACDIAPKELTCPGEFVDPIPLHKGVKYVYLGAGKRLSDFGPLDPIILDAPGNHGGEGRNIGFGDGRVDWFAEDLVPSVFAEAAANRSTTRPAALTRPTASGNHRGHAG